MTISQSPLISAPKGATPEKEAEVGSDFPKNHTDGTQACVEWGSMLCPTHARNSSTSHKACAADSWDASPHVLWG